MSGEYKNIVGYSPSDFFYVSALDSSQGFDCENPTLKKWILSADSASTNGGGTTAPPSGGGEVTGYSFCPTAAPCTFITPTPSSTPTTDPGTTAPPLTIDPAGTTAPPTTDPGTTPPSSDPNMTTTSIPTTSPPEFVPDAKTIQLYKDVCINKSLVNSWTDHKINHSGSQQALNDAEHRYHAAVLNTVNLVGGIGFIVWAFASGWMYR